MFEKEPLISILVLSYNSSKTICDTLNSIKNQKYKKIEIVVADDCSSDDTINVVRRWSNAHSYKIKLLRNEKNLGISLNFAYGVQQCSGNWIKSIAADDILMPTCISDYISELENRDDLYFIYSNMLCFNDKNVWKCLDSYRERKMRKWNDYSQKKQKSKILKSVLGLTPSFFFNRLKYIELENNDIICKNLEDWPLQLSIVLNGYKIHYIDKITVKYRKHESISDVKKDSFYNRNILNNINKIKKEICYPNIKKYNVGYWINEIFLKFNQYVVLNLFKNRKTKASLFINFVLQMFYVNGIKKNIACLLQLMKGKNNI